MRLMVFYVVRTISDCRSRKLPEKHDGKVKKQACNSNSKWHLLQEPHKGRKVHGRFLIAQRVNASIGSGLRRRLRALNEGNCFLRFTAFDNGANGVDSLSLIMQCLLDGLGHVSCDDDCHANAAVEGAVKLAVIEP